MSNPRLRPVYYALGAFLLIWLLVWGAYQIGENSKMTVEKLQHYLNSVELATLSPTDRATAILRLEQMINALSPEERKRWRSEHGGRDWFAEMTEAERGQFLDAIMPSGFKQMLDSFSELPEEKRKKVVDDALRNMRANPNPGSTNGNSSEALSPELEQKVRAIGLKAFYTQSSAQTKAELAPLVEEMQHQIQSGRGMR